MEGIIIYPFFRMTEMICPLSTHEQTCWFYIQFWSVSAWSYRRNAWYLSKQNFTLCVLKFLSRCHSCVLMKLSELYS